MRRIVALCMLVMSMSLIAAVPSLAGGNTAQLTLTCGSNTYAVTIAGNGAWAPARDNNSTLVFHPTAFGVVTRTFTPSDGGEPQIQIVPAKEFQAQPANGHPTADCRFRGEFTNAGGTQITEGGVSGYITGARNNG